jgi:hypothetical protein
LQRARERFPEATPLIIISDNGPQFIARDFKDFIGTCGTTLVRTSLSYRKRTAKSKGGINR